MLIFYSLLSFYSIIHKGADFQKGDTGSVQISAMTTNNNLFPIDLKYLCNNISFITDSSLGANLIGKEIHTKSFEFQYGNTKKNELMICSKEINNKEIDYLIRNDYRLNFNINRFKVRDNYSFGLSFGKDSIIYNHFKIYIHYKTSNTTGMNIITGLTGTSESQKSSNKDKIIFTFSIQLTKKDTEFDDTIFGTLIHQLYLFIMIIVNIILIFLIIYFSVKSDIDSDSNENSVGIDYEENFWYFMRGDIFRKPKRLSLLCSLSGYGFQLLLTSLFTSFMAYKSESSLIHMFLFFMLLFSLFSGFLSVRLFKMSEGSDWRTLIFYNVFLLPIVIFATFLIGHITNYEMTSSTCLTLNNCLKVLGGCSLHIFLSLIGSIISLTMKVPSLPFKVNLIPKQPVRQPFYLRGLTKISIVGLFVSLNIGISFDVIFRMMYGMRSVSAGPFLAFEVLLLLFLSSFSASLVFLYICVKRESYNWWWSSFLGPAFCGAVYLFLAVIYFFANSLGDFLSFVVFLLSNGLIAAAFAATAGFCGFWSCFLFLRVLYGTLA